MTKQAFLNFAHLKITDKLLSLLVLNTGRFNGTAAVQLKAGFSLRKLLPKI